MVLALLLAACSSSVPVCEGTETIETSAGALSCDLARTPTRYLRILAGRALPPGTTAAGIATVVKRYQADPEGTRQWLEQLQDDGRAIEQTAGLAGAELRAGAVWRAIAGEGLLHDDDPDLGTVVTKALSVRARDDEEKLALTETDVESWITYASLCHEVQGTGVLRVSVAHRVDIYEMVRQRFEQGDRAEMVALASFGPAWETVVDRWKAASYDTQQAWMRAAPLPPPMQGTALGYFEVVLEGDVVNAAASIHRSFGPLHFRDGPGYFEPRSP